MAEDKGRTSLIGRVRARCGEFWWWSALIFLSCRIGDAINAFIGLWLVPRFVNPDELGATLPLFHICAVFGLPISVFIYAFSRWLTLYAARGELGKVKRLLRLVLGGVTVAFVVAVLSARFLMPHIFERLRIAEGSLGLLIICNGMIGPVAMTFNNALQGLKRFGAMSIINFISAPARLVAMLAAMPFRALSGYLVGQMASPAMTVAISAFSLRRELGSGVKSEPIGREDVLKMVRHTMPTAVYVVLTTVFAAWQALLVRQRLPEVESAAFYIVSRLAEVATYAGVSLTMVAFPLAAEASEKGAAESMRVLKRLLWGTFLPGAILTLLFVFVARPVMRLVPVWAAYESYSGLMPLYSLRLTLTAVFAAFAACEIAAARFRFLWYFVPLATFETLGLLSLTGYGAFQGILPDAAVDWMRSLNAASLQFFLWWMVAFSIANVAAVVMHMVCRKSKV